MIPSRLASVSSRKGADSNASPACGYGFQARMVATSGTRTAVKPVSNCFSNAAMLSRNVCRSNSNSTSVNVQVSSLLSAANDA